MTCPLSVLVLTHNEEANLPALLDSVHGWVEAIYVVDSGSTDRTVEIAESYGALVKYNLWKTYADQFNWGLDNMPITTPWVMRMDADERVTPELAQELQQVLPWLSESIAALYVKRQVHFMGRWIRHGSYYPTWLLRVFRCGMARCEDRWMDEHMVLSGGTTRRLEHDIIDENHKGLSFWTIKHEHYAEREIKDLLGQPNTRDETQISTSLFGAQDQRKRWIKSNIYARAPLFLRAFAYFCYRYFLRLGFLDGPEGLIFHVLQGFWYRFYVDAKIWEMRHQAQIAEPSGRLSEGSRGDVSVS